MTQPGSSVWHELVWRSLLCFTLIFALLQLTMVAGQLYIVISYAMSNDTVAFAYSRLSGKIGFIFYIVVVSVNGLSVLLLIGGQWAEAACLALPAILLQPAVLGVHLFHYAATIGAEWTNLSTASGQTDILDLYRNIYIITPETTTGKALALLNLAAICFPLLFTLIALLSCRSIIIGRTLRYQEDRMQTTVRSILSQNFANQNRHIANQLYPEREPKVLQPIVIAHNNGGGVGGGGTSGVVAETISDQNNAVRGDLRTVISPPRRPQRNNRIAATAPPLADEESELPHRPLNRRSDVRQEFHSRQPPPSYNEPRNQTTNRTGHVQTQSPNHYELESEEGSSVWSTYEEYCNSQTSHQGPITGISTDNNARRGEHGTLNRILPANQKPAPRRGDPGLPESPPESDGLPGYASATGLGVPARHSRRR